MTSTEPFRERIERIASVHPQERERLERCAAIIAERDSEMLTRAFDKQLDRIETAKRPADVRKQIDRMEHTLTESALLSPFLGAREGGARKRAWIIGLLIAASIVVLVLDFYLRGGA